LNFDPFIIRFLKYFWTKSKRGSFKTFSHF